MIQLVDKPEYTAKGAKNLASLKQRLIKMSVKVEPAELTDDERQRRSHAVMRHMENRQKL